MKFENALVASPDVFFLVDMIHPDAGSYVGRLLHPVETSDKVLIRKWLRLLTFWVDHVMARPLVTFSLNSIN